MGKEDGRSSENTREVVCFYVTYTKSSHPTRPTRPLFGWRPTSRGGEPLKLLGAPPPSGDPRDLPPPAAVTQLPPLSQALLDRIASLTPQSFRPPTSNRAWYGGTQYHTDCTCLVICPPAYIDKELLDGTLQVAPPPWILPPKTDSSSVSALTVALCREK